MRVVIYDPEDFEALTVLDVPQHFIRDMEEGKRGRILNFHVPASFDHFSRYDPCDTPAFVQIERGIIEFEKLQRRSRSGIVETWTGFALNPVTCLKLRSDLLPGQRRDVDQREDLAFIRGVMAAMN